MTPIIDTGTVTAPAPETLPDPTPELTPTVPLAVPVTAAEWDAIASSGEDTLPDLDPLTTPDTPTVGGSGNGKFCEVCGKALTGKQRRFCADHTRGGTTTGTTAGTRKGSSWKGGARVEANLNDLITTIAGGLLFFPNDTPIHKDGDTIYRFGPRVAHELVSLADDDPRMRKVLERLAAPGKYGGLVIALGGLVLGLASNHNLLPTAVGDALNAFTPAGGETHT